jgi:serine/threonine protein kinase
LGIEELHRNNIMYRDLKPENVLIFSDGYVKLADFGLSKVLDKAQLTKTEAGTVSYLAPEVIAKKGYNKLIDFWTLGIFIYELATSESPFRHDEILTRPTFKSKVEQAERNRDWKDF